VLLGFYQIYVIFSFKVYSTKSKYKSVLTPYSNVNILWVKRIIDLVDYISKWLILVIKALHSTIRK